MRPDDIRSLSELLVALGDDARFAGYRAEPQGNGAIELQGGDARLLLLDAGDPGTRRRLESHLARARAGEARPVLLGDDDQLHATALDGHAADVALAVLPISRARLAAVLSSELEVVRLRSRDGEAHRRADRYSYELSEMLAISRAISSERDVVALLGLILQKGRDVTGADAGSIYTIEGQELSIERRRLRFMVSQNDSLPVDFRAFGIPVDDRSIVGKTVQSRAVINIPDLDRLDEPGANPWGVRHNRSLDEQSGYRTRSMLCVPLINQHEEVIGVIQLINRKRDPQRPLRSPADFDALVIAFDQRAEELAETLAAHAGISLENALLTDEIQQLFEGFVNASITAIESRDPTTSGHSQRVAALTCRLAEAVNRTDSGPLAEVRFSPDELKQIEYACLLHDFGKVAVKEKVLLKANKLYEHEREQLLLRFDFIRKSVEAEAMRRRVAAAAGGSRPAQGDRHADLGGGLDEQARAELQRIDRFVDVVLAANEPSIPASGQASGEPSGRFEQIEEIARQTFRDPRGEVRSYLTPAEAQALKLERGTLTPAERREIESHVLHTFNFLATIPWGRKLNRIPLIAGTHHERLDGSGYPWNLQAADIPVEARMMALGDVFDALTASDRPYKRAAPVERALAILQDEVRAGRCDAELLRLFIEARVWEPVAPRS